MSNFRISTSYPVFQQLCSFQVLFIKLKEAQYRNAVSDAELAKLKARVGTNFLFCCITFNHDLS